MLQKLLQYVEVIYQKNLPHAISQIKNGGIQIILPAKMGKLKEKDTLYHELAHVYRGDLFSFNNDLILDNYEEPVKTLLHGKLPTVYDTIIDHALYDQDNLYGVKTVIAHKGIPLAGYTEWELADLIAGYIKKEIKKQGGSFKESFTIPITIDPEQETEMLFDLEQTQDQYQNGSHTESDNTDEVREVASLLKELKEELDFDAQLLTPEQKTFKSALQTVSIPRLVSMLLGDIESDLHETSIMHPSNLNPDRYSEKPIEKSRVNVVMDVSGSMWDTIPYCLDILKRLNTFINLILIDEEIRSIKEIPPPFRGGLEVLGNGGTDLTPAFKKIKEKRWNQYRTLVLTDSEFEPIRETMRNRFWLIYQGDHSRIDSIPKSEKAFSMNNKHVKQHVKEARNGSKQ